MENVPTLLERPAVRVQACWASDVTEVAARVTSSKHGAGFGLILAALDLAPAGEVNVQRLLHALAS